MKSAVQGAVQLQGVRSASSDSNFIQSASQRLRGRANEAEERAQGSLVRSGGLWVRTRGV